MWLLKHQRSPPLTVPLGAPAPAPHREAFWATRLRVVVLVLVVLALLLGGGVLVLLVLGHEVVHVGLGLRELHLVHALASVPVKEGLAAEHSCELLRHPLEHLLDGGGVANE